MTEPINPTSANTMHASMAISRKIHKQLVSKKNRWKPSELELAVLKIHFQKNKYPIKEDKEAIIKSLEEQFGSKIDINQLSRWFQHEREKATKNSSKVVIKNTYKKFGKEELDYLQELFNTNNYPKMEEMVAVAKKLGVGLSKIENWYKHNRRSLAKRGFFTLKTKKYFKRDELSYLVEMFETCPRPSKEQILEMADRLECSESQIKNWYSNKRKKLKFMAKKQCAESTEASLHKTSFSGYSKLGSVSDLTPNQDVNLSFQTNSYQQLMDQKSTSLPNFLINRPLPTLPTTNPYNNFASNNLPVLIIPSNINTNSSMVFNTNIINNTDAVSISSTAPSTTMQSEKESRPSFTEFQAIKASSEPVKPIISSPLQPSKLFNNLFQNTPSNSFQNAPMIQIPVPLSNVAQNTQQTQFSQFQSTMSMFANKGPVFNQAVQNGTINTNIPMMSTIPGSYSFPLNNLNAINQMGSLSQLPQFNQVTGGRPSESPMQIQYLTSLYLPYSNNNIFNNCYPMVYANGSDMCIPGQMQPQMNLSNLMPATGAGFNSH